MNAMRANALAESPAGAHFRAGTAGTRRDKDEENERWCGLQAAAMERGETGTGRGQGGDSGDREREERPSFFFCFSTSKLTRPVQGG